MGLSMYCCLKTIPAARALASVFSFIFSFIPTAGGIKQRFLVRTGRKSGTGCCRSRAASVFWQRRHTTVLPFLRHTKDASSGSIYNKVITVLKYNYFTGVYKCHAYLYSPHIILLSHYYIFTLEVQIRTVTKNQNFSVIDCMNHDNYSDNISQL